jgi:arylsulfatase A-like enzyme
VRCLGASLVLASCAARPDSAADGFVGPRPKNLVILSMDTLARDRTGPSVTPTLDALATSGVRLANHASCSNWTLQSVLCAQTGSNPLSLPYLAEITLDPEPRPLPSTLPSLLPEHFSVFASANAYFSSAWGTDAGYARSVYEEDASLIRLHTQAIELLEAGRGAGPWVYHLHAFEPHVPYAPPEAYLVGLEDLPPIAYDLASAPDHYDALVRWVAMSEAERANVLAHMELRYEAELRWLDDQLAEVLADLRGRGLLADALVVVWSDHGEGFFEHFNQGHAYALYGEETDAIALLWSETIVPAVIDAPTTHADLVPTVLDALGYAAPPGLDGLPARLVPADRPRTAFTAARSGVVQSAEVAGGRLHYWWSGSKRYYDHAADPLETTDIYDPSSPGVQAAWAVLGPEVDAAAARITSLQPIDSGP